MIKERDLLFVLIKYLTSHGYPEEALALEWKIGQKYRVDLAVIEPITNKLLALFELKSQKSQQSFDMTINQLKNYKKELGNEEVFTYAVFPTDDNSSFEFYSLDTDKENVSQVEQLPEYLVLKNSKVRKEILETEQLQKSTLDWFQIICWILAAAILILLILEFTGKIKLTPERLVLIGIIIGLIVVPVASKLKILGVEFERYKKEDISKK